MGSSAGFCRCLIVNIGMRRPTVNRAVKISLRLRVTDAY